MREFTLVERTEPFTLKEVIDFIDDEATDISKLDAHELKCRIVDVIQTERNKAIDDFADKLKDSLLHNYRHLLTIDKYGFEWLTTNAVETHIDEIAEQLKVGSND